MVRVGIEHGDMILEDFKTGPKIYYISNGVSPNTNAPLVEWGNT